MITLQEKDRVTMSRSKLILLKLTVLLKEITVVVTIHEADSRKQNFGQVRNSFIRIFNSDTNEEILKYELDEDFSIETAVEFGRIYNRNGEWKFEAVGAGQRDGLEKFVSIYQVIMDNQENQPIDPLGSIELKTFEPTQWFPNSGSACSECGAGSSCGQRGKCKSDTAAVRRTSEI